jgi:hypothetical protein
MADYDAAPWIRGERADNQEKVIVASEAALTVFTSLAFPKDWAQTRTFSADSLIGCGCTGNRRINLEKAIAACHRLAALAGAGLLQQARPLSLTPCSLRVAARVDSNFAPVIVRFCLSVAGRRCPATGYGSGRVQFSPRPKGLCPDLHRDVR